jgi:thiamine pyrophosphate-dependent acetolactate synthase large subunit-like protein
MPTARPSIVASVGAVEDSSITPDRAVSPVMPIATEKYRSTDISGNYADMAKAFGGYGERVTQPYEIVPAIRRAVKVTQEGTPALLEFITGKEIQYSMYK